MAEAAKRHGIRQLTGSTRPEGSDGHPIYCLVPPELPELVPPLVDHFAADPRISVVVDRRRRERRSGTDRRAPGAQAPDWIERRVGEGLEGRRFVDRRAATVAVEAPPLPPEAQGKAERLSFVKRVESPAESEELDRLHNLAEGWRERCAQAVREARASRFAGQDQGVQALSAALAARDSYTWEHAAAVVWLALECAEQLQLEEQVMAEIRDVAFLHDIGKLGIPDLILGKPDSLTSAEWEVMRRHPVIGAEIVSSIDSLKHLAPAIRAEHERWDGLGYPDGLAKEQIPVSSRIVFVCDAYHAMVSERPYRPALSAEAAGREIADNAGAQFSPDCAWALLRVVSPTDGDSSGLAT